MSVSSQTNSGAEREEKISSSSSAGSSSELEATLSLHLGTLNRIYVFNNTLCIISPNDSINLYNTYQQLLNTVKNVVEVPFSSPPSKTFYICYRINGDQLKRINRGLSSSAGCSKMVVSDETIESTMKSVPPICQSIVDQDLSSNCVLCSCKGDKTRLRIRTLNTYLGINNSNLTVQYTHKNNWSNLSLRLNYSSSSVVHLSYPKLTYDFGCGRMLPEANTKARVCCLISSIHVDQISNNNNNNNNITLIMMM